MEGKEVTKDDVAVAQEGARGTAIQPRSLEA
jgi:hypothetical protein